MKVDTPQKVKKREGGTGNIQDISPRETSRLIPLLFSVKNHPLPPPPLPLIKLGTHVLQPIYPPALAARAKTIDTSYPCTD